MNVSFKARILAILLPYFIIDVLSRLLGLLLNIFQVNKGISAEAITRAKLYNLKHDYKASYIGRSVVFDRPYNISLGKNTIVRHGVVIAPGNSFFEMKDGSHISHNSVMAAAGGIYIGENCMISSGVIIYSIDQQKSQDNSKLPIERVKATVTIGDDVHIGANVTILPGVHIGDNATIGAGAVVTKDVMSGATAIGVPAKSISSPNSKPC